MAEFDIQQFEDRISDLVAAYQHLRGENHQLKQDIETLKHKNTHTRQQLQSIVERIVTLEKEAETQQ